MISLLRVQVSQKQDNLNPLNLLIRYWPKTRKGVAGIQNQYCLMALNPWCKLRMISRMHKSKNITGIEISYREPPHCGQTLHSACFFSIDEASWNNTRGACANTFETKVLLKDLKKAFNICNTFVPYSRCNITCILMSLSAKYGSSHVLAMLTCYSWDTSDLLSGSACYVLMSWLFLAP